MRVCTARQMAAIDRETIAGGIRGDTLMERAGTAMTEHLLDFLDELDTHGQEPQVLVLCGKGNNGGDGLVVARLLAEQEIPVVVLLLAGGAPLSDDAATNRDRLPTAVTVVDPPREQWDETLALLLEEADVVVDAVFGTGIQPPLRGEIADLVRQVNDAGLPCVALDIPSGVCGDDGRVDPVAVAADLTITVQMPKLGLLLPPGRDFTGRLEIVDIGFPETIRDRHAMALQWLTPADYLELLPPRRSDAHKYECGSVLGIGGSAAFGGAAHLMGLGALRSGAGMVTLGIPAGLEMSLHASLPEVILAALARTDNGTIAPVPETVAAALLERKDAVALGPGLGADTETDAWVVDFLKRLDRPVVVDADGLGAFARAGVHPACGQGGAVLTPHAGELGRLAGLSSAAVVARRFELLPELAAAWGAVVLLKGSPSLIAAPDGRLFLNSSGDDALARGGSGDVLTGLIGGLLAQGLDPLDAALLGAHVHGRAGTLAAEGRGTRSVRVVEIAAAIGPVFESMEKDASSSAELRERLWPISRAGESE